MIVKRERRRFLTSLDPIGEIHESARLRRTRQGGAGIQRRNRRGGADQPRRQPAGGRPPVRRGADGGQADGKVTTPMKLDPARLITHRFTLDQILDAYDTFGRAADTQALKVIISA